MKIPIDLIQNVLPDRYQLEKELTAKPDRQTWLAQDKQGNNSVVLKILWFSGPSIWQDLTYFEREAQLLQQISHPAIPKFIDYFDLQIENHHGFVLVQQYIPARSLSQHRDQGRTFSEVDIKQIIEQVLEILIYLHQQDPPIVHRDIKPSNLLLGDRSAHGVGQIYLVDFGVAKTLTESVGKTLTVVGSYGYAPLEQFGGRSVPASDIYSLGATIVYLLTGRHPAELPQVDLAIQFETATTISSDLKNWIKTATQPFLDRRFLNAEAALKDLNHPVAFNLSSSKPYGTKITCCKFDTFLQIKRPLNDQTCVTIIARNTVNRIPMWIYAIFLALFINLITFISFILLDLKKTNPDQLFWTLAGLGFMLPAVLFTYYIRQSQLYRIYSVVPWLTHQEYQISKDEIQFKCHLLFNRMPQVQSIRRSALKQIDRIQMHKTGRESQDENGPYILWTDVPTKIELRSDITFTIDNLEEPEADWLCAELSDYLGIPVVTHTIGQ